MKDDEQTESSGNWVVFNLDGVVVASSTQEENKARSVSVVVCTLPVGVYLLHSSDSATGKAIVRRIHVQP